MELGAQRKQPIAATKPTKTKANMTNPTRSARNANKSVSTNDPIQAMPSKLDLRKQRPYAHPTDLHPRYSIIAYGCSDVVYKGMSSTQQAIFQDLLGTTSFLADRPRQDEAMLGAAKPFWSSGLSSYGWLDEKILHQMPDDAATDGLTTGPNFLVGNDAVHPC
jgi:hypothetical protein